MHGLMMDMPLLISGLIAHADRHHGDAEIVSKTVDGSVHRYTYSDAHARAQKLANALQRLGVQPGERVATLAWNHSRHLEAYFGIPLMGGVLHTLNPRLSGADLAYIVNHAEDRVLLVDDVLLPVWERFRHEVKIKNVVVWGNATGGTGPAAPEGAIDYEE